MPKMLVVRVPTGQAEGACRIDDQPYDFAIDGPTIRLRPQGGPSREWDTWGFRSGEWKAWTIHDEGSEPEALRREGTTLLRLKPMPE